MIVARAIVVELEDGSRLYSPHALVDDSGGVLFVEPLVQL